MHTITVNLADRSYPILLGKRTSDRLPSELEKRFPRSRFVIVTNTTLADLYRPILDAWCTSLDAALCVIPDGEQHKSLKTWQGILDGFFSAGLERTSVAVAFGGGVVGDITGFAAACFLRGIDYVQVPTTLLAMVDSSVGGKTAVNHAAGKNLIGAFHQPRFVLIDLSFLQTLPRREFVAGYGELFKYAFIGGREMFQFVMKNRAALLKGDARVLLDGIERSLRIKASVVADDERESGSRALLNFGHTFAHALEKFYHYRGMLHGEAVLWGIVCACDLGRRVGTIPSESVDMYKSILAGTPQPKPPTRPDPEKLYAAMFSDKKVKHGALRFVLPTEPGTSEVRAGVPKEAVRETLGAVFGEELPTKHMKRTRKRGQSDGQIPD